MKIVVCAPYRDGTGYAKAAIENILALDSAGIEVVPRSIKMTNTTGEVPSRIDELEKKDLLGVDVLYQYNLPSEFVYKGGVKNVGRYDYETDSFSNSDWIHQLGMMDQVIVSCEHQKTAISNQSSDVESKTIVVPHSVDMKKFSDDHKTIDFGLPKDTIKFYTIAEFGRRKNIPALLLAYFSRFSSDDNVALIIKTHMPNRNQAAASEAIRGIIDDLKQGMGRFASLDRYPKVVLQTGYMTDDEINSIHNSCDAFVTASHGEAWCLPAIDALGFGNTVIAPNHSAFKDYISNNSAGILVGGVESPVFGVSGAPAGLYTSDENWYNVSVNDLGSAMERFANHADKWNSDTNRRARYHSIDMYCSREVVGFRLKKVLES
jgi:glycosyltransferase involved in cell wall biosynthesis